MALTTSSIALKPNQTHHSPSYSKPTSQFTKKKQPTTVTRRRTTSVLMFSPVLLAIAQEAILISSSKSAAAKAEGNNPFDLLRITVPDQTVEEAEDGIRPHASRLLEVKELLDEGMDSWKEAQRELRWSSALLKQDLYTIIQGKPGVERPLLRDLYFKLFTNVSGLDYAARDMDVTRVWECYRNIVVTIDEILSKI